MWDLNGPTQSYVGVFLKLAPINVGSKILLNPNSKNWHKNNEII